MFKENCRIAERASGVPRTIAIFDCESEDHSFSFGDSQNLFVVSNTPRGPRLFCKDWLKRNALSGSPSFPADTWSMMLENCRSVSCRLVFAMELECRAWNDSSFLTTSLSCRVIL